MCILVTVGSWEMSGTEPVELMGDKPINLGRGVQTYPSQTHYVRRGSLKPPEPESDKRGPVRPSLQGRTLSAPLVERYRHVSREPTRTGRHAAPNDDDDPVSGTSQWQEDDESAPPVPPTRFDSLPASMVCMSHITLCFHALADIVCVHSSRTDYQKSTSL